MSLQINTAQNVDVDYEIASVVDRIVAQLIDYILYFCWIIAIISLMAYFKSGFGSASPWIAGTVIMMPILLYPLLCEFFLDGQTVGKMVLKIKVIRLDGSKATISAYLLRWLLTIVDISLFSGLVAIMTIAINGKGQRLGDIAAGTTVIKTKPRIQLDQILHPSLKEDYQPIYTTVAQLSDTDIRTIRKVLASGNEELMETAMYKIESILKVHSLDTGHAFLTQIINDYDYYMSKE